MYPHLFTMTLSVIVKRPNKTQIGVNSQCIEVSSINYGTGTQQNILKLLTSSYTPTWKDPKGI